MPASRILTSFVKESKGRFLSEETVADDQVNPIRMQDLRVEAMEVTLLIMGLVDIQDMIGTQEMSTSKMEEGLVP